MIVTVLWEDQRGVETKNFGPHELLIACVADDTGIGRFGLKEQLKSLPKKGNGNVRHALKQDLGRIARSGPVFAVIDRDKVRDLWKKAPPPVPDCMSGIASRLRSEAPGDYELVFLVQNAETLVEHARTALGRIALRDKPTPEERDADLNALAWQPGRGGRDRLREACKSFARLVDRVVACLPAPEGGDATKVESEAQ